jgi:hypothetical protein
MSAEAILIGEILSGILCVFVERLRAAGVKEEEIEGMLLDMIVKVRETKPEDLPDV